MDTQELFAITFVVCIAAGVAMIWLTLQQRTRMLEMRHRERMAMIERGQVPPATDRDVALRSAGSGGSARAMSVGIVLVGLGLALAVLLGFAAGSPETGVGLGGAVAILGGAFIAKSMLVRPSAPSPLSPPALPYERSSDETHQ